MKDVVVVDDILSCFGLGLEDGLSLGVVEGVGGFGEVVDGVADV